MIRSVLLLALATNAWGWTNNKGYDDSFAPNWSSMPVASCIAGAAYPNWDVPASDAPAAACATGTNTNKGVLDFDDGTTSGFTSPSIQNLFPLPPDWVSTNGLEIALKWMTTDTGTSENVRWCAQVVCVADGETDDPAFDTAVCVNDLNKGGSLQTNDATTIALTGASIDTCAAGELMHVKIYRDADNAADDSDGNARLVSVRLMFRTQE